MTVSTLNKIAGRMIFKYCDCFITVNFCFVLAFLYLKHTNLFLKPKIFFKCLPKTINGFFEIIFLFCNIHVLSPLEIKIIWFHYAISCNFLHEVKSVTSIMSSTLLLIILRLLIVCLLQ